MTTYNIDLDGDTLKIGFGEPAQNDQIVKDVESRLRHLKLQGGKLLKISGAASLPVAFALAHGVNHLYGAIAVFDPKLGKFVVAITHSPGYKVGDLIK
jgi:CRISPR-associated protein Csx3